MDYCTMFPDGTWSYCCCIHDRRYSNKRLTRKQADILLKRCVKNRIKNKLLKYIIPNIMYIGVRLFGYYFYKKAKSEGINGTRCSE